LRPAELAPVSTKRAAHGLVAILPQNFGFTVTGDMFGGLIEKKDSSIDIMRNDTLFEIIQYALQVVLVGYDSVIQQGSGFLS
jgi:hypothetical protein